MKVKNEIPPVVSGRNHLPQIDDYVELAIHDPRLGFEDSESMHAALRYVLKRFAYSITLAMQKASDNGMNQALALIEDPEYYGNTKRRRDLSMKRKKEKWDIENQERIRREMNPTPKDIAQNRKWLSDMVAYHRRSLAEAEGKLKAFEASHFNIRSEER